MTAAQTPVKPSGPRWARALLLLVPAVWLGLVIGISLIEAPLKFTAPGITIPLGLGIGRRVFLAMNAVEAVLAVLVILVLVRTLGRPRFRRSVHPLWPLGLAAAGLLVVKALVIRPFLNVRTDAVLAGESAGGSATHLFYIGAEMLLLVVLVALLIAAARAVVPPSTP